MLLALGSVDDGGWGDGLLNLLFDFFSSDPRLPSNHSKPSDIHVGRGLLAEVPHGCCTHGEGDAGHVSGQGPVEVWLLPRREHCHYRRENLVDEESQELLALERRLLHLFEESVIKPDVF